jgi:hypothetical protein
MLAIRHIGDHDVVVGSVEQKFAEQFDGLPLGHVGIGLHQLEIVLGEEQIVVGIEEACGYRFVPRDDFLHDI